MTSKSTTKESIVIKNLKKEYSDVKAVKGVSFSVKKGEIFGFLGPNGAGKTTTINCITQLSSITSGTILVNGYDVVTDYLDARTQIGLSPQDLNFDIYFSVLNTLIYQAGYFGIKKNEAKKRALKLLKEFGILDKKDELFRGLSGGMKRKLSIIKAIIHEPQILILDEPTAALDVDSRYELWEFIKKLNKTKGITIFLTTHYIEEAEKLCERICIINKGKIIKLDTTEKIMNELSQNIISIYLEKETNLPTAIKKYKYDYNNRKLEIKVAKKDQNKVLREVLKILEDAGAEVVNFGLEQEKLENIFRRLVHSEGSK